MSEAMKVGQKLVELCRAGKFREAMESLYGADIVSIEPHDMPMFPRRQEGIAAVRKKSDWWEQNHEVHGAKVEGPWLNGDRFTVVFRLDVTPKAGPMAGKRMQMEEVGLYTVRGGKVVEESFFYGSGS